MCNNLEKIVWSPSGHVRFPTTRCRIELEAARRNKWISQTQFSTLLSSHSPFLYLQ